MAILDRLSNEAPGQFQRNPAFPERVMSIDALRGFDMFWIIGADAVVRALQAFAPNPFTRVAATQLEHVEWEGFRFYDLIFPLFVFLVGVSLVFSLGRTIEQAGRRVALGRVLRRSALLYLLGILYYGGFAHDWPNIRLVGVLQRIALCYLGAGLLFCFLRVRGLVIAWALLLIGYWAVMAFVPIPGFAGDRWEMGTNLASYIDAHYLPGKRWDGTWDPEGLLSTFPAIATCLLGVFAGMLLRQARFAPMTRVQHLVTGGIALLAAGYLWSIPMPIIKKIWTSSYVLVAGGYSALLLALFYWMIDVRGWRRWCQPFVWIGMNAITIYLLSAFINFRDVALRFAGGDMRYFWDWALTPGVGELLVAFIELGLAVLICWWLYRRRIFLRL